MPREDPVTNATLSVNRMSCSGTSSVQFWHGLLCAAKVGASCRKPGTGFLQIRRDNKDLGQAA
jgi:hypothetical protein